MLDVLGLRNVYSMSQGNDARQLAQMTLTAVMVNKLSLLNRFAENYLIKIHMAHNRSAFPTSLRLASHIQQPTANADICTAECAGSERWLCAYA
jgi:hydroxymethylglutaryl-CoA reductase